MRLCPTILALTERGQQKKRPLVVVVVVVVVCWRAVRSTFSYSWKSSFGEPSLEPRLDDHRAHPELLAPTRKGLGFYTFWYGASASPNVDVVTIVLAIRFPNFVHHALSMNDPPVCL